MTLSSSPKRARKRAKTEYLIYWAIQGTQVVKAESVDAARKEVIAKINAAWPACAAVPGDITIRGFDFKDLEGRA